MKQVVVGVDWGHEHVQFVAEDDEGRPLWERRCAAKPEGIADAIRSLRELGTQLAAAVAVAIELRGGRLVEAFLDSGFDVWFVRPAQVDDARKLRFASRAKDDRRDARTMAWMLRTMKEALIRVVAPEVAVVELQRLTRTRAGLVVDRTRVKNQITGLFREVFPEMLELATPDVKWFTAVWRLVRTPDGAHATAHADLAAVLKRFRVRKFDADQVLATLRRGKMYDGRGDWTIEAELAFDRLELLEKQVALLESRIEERLAALHEAQLEQARRARKTAQCAGEGVPRPVSDVEIVRSLPGVGATLTAVFIAERLPDYVKTDLPLARAVTGVAPVHSTTGKQQTRRNGQIVMRRACNGHLRNAVHLAVEKALGDDPWVTEQYAALRARNHTHGRACRQIADRLLTRLRAMLRDRTLYESPTSRVQAQAS